MRLKSQKKNNLVTVLSKVTKPLCLLGSWAVYLTVNENCRKVYGLTEEEEEESEESLIQNNTSSESKVVL